MGFDREIVGSKTIRTTVGLDSPKRFPITSRSSPVFLFSFYSATTFIFTNRLYIFTSKMIVIILFIPRLGVRDRVIWH